MNLAALRFSDRVVTVTLNGVDFQMSPVPGSVMIELGRRLPEPMAPMTPDERGDPSSIACPMVPDDSDPKYRDAYRLWNVRHMLSEVAGAFGFEDAMGRKLSAVVGSDEAFRGWLADAMKLLDSLEDGGGGWSANDVNALYVRLNEISQVRFEGVADKKKGSIPAEAKP